jgi:mannose/fructose/N-acetylgalactosamine-specific phosphotransferase system component IIB
MSIQLYRVDERLIHGQVIVAWANELHPERIIIVDDDLAASEWEQELYALGLPDEMVAVFSSVEDAANRLAEWEADTVRSILLTREVETMTRLAASGRLQGKEINIGGLHYAPGRRSILPYVYLSEAERHALRDLVESGAVPSARDLPGARRVPAERLLRGGPEAS